MLNMRVPLIGNSVDLCLLSCEVPGGVSPNVLERELFADGRPDIYVALGELKGGIDPAGADEHWKTARTALSRIWASFAGLGLSPKVFFVGAAIAEKMADEIWRHLETGTLTNAANLIDAAQFGSICSWLTDI
jgi:type II restriction enzyme